MPCYDPEPNERDLRAWTVEQALIEIAGGTPNYKPNRYNEGWGDIRTLDANTDKLCSFLRQQHPQTIRSYSLELQIWWRDHQMEDAKRHAHQQKLR